MKVLTPRDRDTLRLVTICDPHLSSHNPSSWREDAPSYEEHNAAVLRQVWRFAHAKRADAILCAGDVFHLKPEARNPVPFLIRTARLFKEAPCPVFGIAGNHDMPRGSAENGIGAPLEALCEMGAYHLLDHDPVEYELPWTGTQSWVVRIAGASFDHGRAGSFMRLDAGDLGGTHRPADYLISLGHFAFGPKSGSFYGEPVYGPDTLGDAAFDVAVLGHHHYDQGIREHAGKLYVSHGSTAWTSVHRADAERRPAAGFLEIRRGEDVVFNVLRPKVAPFGDVVDTEGHAQAIQESEEIDEFVASLGSVQFDAADPGAVLDGMDAAREVKERAKAYLEDAEA